MDIEKQVVSLELAKKLKEAKYPQGKSLWIWCTKDEWKPFLKLREDMSNEAWKLFTTYAAPTVAELGEKLPKTFDNCPLGQIWNGGEILFVAGEKVIWRSNTYDNGITEADARAKMRLYLKEKKLSVIE